MMNGVEPQSAFEGYIKSQVETLNREMMAVNKKLDMISESWIFSRGKIAGYAGAFGIIGGGLTLLIKTLWR